MKNSILTAIVAVSALALIQFPAISQEVARRNSNTNPEKTVKSVGSSENREYRITSKTASMASIKACGQLTAGASMKTVRANILNLMVEKNEDISIPDARRLAFAIAQNAQAECGQLGSN